MRFNRYTAWTGPLYPNCTQTWPNATKNGPMFADLKVFGVPLPYGTPATQSKLTWVYDCDAAPGCLFNVETDSTEHTNLAGDPKYANVLAELRSALNASNATLFNPDRGSTTLAACDTAIDQGHFYGPFVGLPDGWYSPRSTPRTPGQVAKDIALKATLKAISGKVAQKAIIAAAKKWASGGGLDKMFDALDKCRNVSLGTLGTLGTLGGGATSLNGEDTKEDVNFLSGVVSRLTKDAQEGVQEGQEGVLGAGGAGEAGEADEAPSSQV